MDDLKEKKNPITELNVYFRRKVSEESSITTGSTFPFDLFSAEVIVQKSLTY